MLRFSISFFAFLLCHSFCLAQDGRRDPERDFEQSALSQEGFTRIEDFSLSRLVLQLGGYADSRIRKVTTEENVKFYFQVEEGKDLGTVNSEDFPRLFKAFATLKNEMSENLRPSADRVVYKYSDPGGLQVGYEVEGKKLTWFVKPDRRYSRAFIIKDPFSLEESLNQAMDALQKLKQ